MIEMTGRIETMREEPAGIEDILISRKTMSIEKSKDEREHPTLVYEDNPINTCSNPQLLTACWN
jgi:hypothetical protein